jgi:hypothetical protein
MKYLGNSYAFRKLETVDNFNNNCRQEGQNGGPSVMLSSADGETTSHLMGFFYRTIRYRFGSINIASPEAEFTNV